METKTQILIEKPIETKPQNPNETKTQNIIDKLTKTPIKSTTDNQSNGSEWKITGITIGWVGIALSIVLGSFAPLIWVYGGKILVIAVISNSGEFHFWL